MSHQPPRSIKVIAILARTAGRRWYNRVCKHMFSRFSRKRPAGRSGTPRKGRRASIFMLLLGVFFFVAILGTASRLVYNLCDELGREEADPQNTGRIELRWMFTYSSLKSAELRRHNASRIADWNAGAHSDTQPVDSRPQDPRELVLLADVEFKGTYGLDETGGHDHESLREYLQFVFADEASEGQKLSGPEAKQFVDRCLDAFEERGVEAFVDSSRHRRGDTFFPSAGWWPGGAEAQLVIRAAALLLAMSALAIFFTTLAGAVHKDLAKVDWDMEWLFTFPVRSTTIFLAKVLEYTLLNVFASFVFLPFLLVLFLAAGFGWWAVVLSIVSTLYINALIAAARLAAETWLRLKVATTRIRSVQALCTIVGMVFLLLVVLVANTPSLPAWFASSVRRAPSAVLWFPPSVPAMLCEGGWPLCAVLAGAGALLAAAVCGSLYACGRLVASGLVGQGGTYVGTRTPQASEAKPARSWRIRGIVGKDLRLLLRDRNLLLRTVLLPPIVVAFNVLIHEGAVEVFLGSFQHTTALAFGLGAYMLLSSAFTVMIVEQKAVWMLYSFPGDIHSVFFRKTILWLAVALVYPIAVMVASLCGGAQWGALDLCRIVLVVAGIAIHAFIASGLGVLATNVQATEPRRMMRTSYIYLYMMLAAAFATAIYSDSPWTWIVQVVLSVLAAGAIWQKVYYRMPYLLDPTQSPPPRIEVSDGIVLVLMFFAIQALVTLLLVHDGSLPPGASLLIAFLSAGAVVTVGSLLVFWRTKVPNLLTVLGLRAGAGAARMRTCIIAGVACGACAAVVAIGYLLVLDAAGLRHALEEQSLRNSPVEQVAGGWWFAVLAIVAAPIFEEYIFRGVLFGGLRRSLPLWAAVVTSAAIFAIIHPTLSAAPVFVLGVTAAVAFAKTRRLLTAVIVHAVYNAAVVAANWGMM